VLAGMVENGCPHAVHCDILRSVVFEDICDFAASPFALLGTSTPLRMIAFV
jgi:hypothetical protein